MGGTSLVYVPDPFHAVIKWRPGGSGLRHTTHIVNVWHATVFCQIFYRVERGNLKNGVI